MKIVTYNVNGLRPRIQQFGSLLNLLNSLDADIICFQETKLAKHDLRADVVWADGYESFFSCTKAPIGYSGVATFCRAASAFSTSQVALPLDAQEGFTGLLENSRGVVSTKKDHSRLVAQGLEGFSIDELLKVDSEGRCIVTDHGHFVLFNIYGPRAGCDDTERIQFKMSFFKILQRRWESLLGQGRRVIVVGDLNIAPSAIDRCDAQPDFEKNEFREWFRSLLVGNGGPFFDVFRVKHPERKEAYTCWSTSSGAEIFNFGSRIDHILTAGTCLHEEHNLASHNFITCHVSECEILTQFKRWQSGNTTRWKGGRGIKLKGSDHAPVCMSLDEVPSILEHSAPSLSTRYSLQVEGCQQTLVSMLARRRSAEQVQTNGQSLSPVEADIAVNRCNESVKRSSDSLDAITSSNLKQGKNVPETAERSQGSTAEASGSKIYSLGSKHSEPVRNVESKKKARQGQFSQLSVRSFFQKSANLSDGISSSGMKSANFDHSCTKISTYNDESNTIKTLESGGNVSIEDQCELEVSNSIVKEKSTVALAEWQRIKEVMQKSIPTCKGHNEPCVARIVKKSGPNLGRRFFVCARAEGPASNREANCGYFKWASSKSKHNGGG